MQTIFLFLLIPFSLNAQSVRWELYWPRNPEPEVTHYRIYQRTGTNWVCVDQTTGTNYGPIGVGTWTITACAPCGESEFGRIVTTISDPTDVRARRLPEIPNKLGNPSK